MRTVVAGGLLLSGVAILFFEVNPFPGESFLMILMGFLVSGIPLYGYIFNEEMIFAPGATIKAGAKSKPSRFMGAICAIMILVIAITRALNVW